MGDKSIFCPIDSCSSNIAGMCNAAYGTPLLFSAFGGNQFGSTVGFIPGFLKNDAMPNSAPPQAPEWSNWRSCPYIRQNLKKK